MSSPQHRSSPWLVPALALALMPLVWIGDISFVWDEPMLIEKALRANAEHRLETVGLEGTRGFHYGPLPTWIYQGLLALTHDLVWVAFLRCAVSNLVVVGSLVWLARSLVLPLPFASVILLSPYLWVYARILWDNTFLMPFSALLLASTFAFFKETRTFQLVIACVCLLALPLIHLMSAAIVVPVALCLVLVRPRALLRAWLPVTVVSLAMLALAFPYLSTVLAAPRTAANAAPLSMESASFAVRAGRFFSASGLDYFFGVDWTDRFLFPGADLLVRATGYVAYGLFALGIVVALRDVFCGSGQRRIAGALLLAIVGAQTALNIATATFHHPHYYNATWVAAALLLWLAADSVWRYRTAHVVFSVQAGLLVLSIAAIAWHVRQQGGDQRGYGPTLANQIAVAREVARLQPREVRFEGPYLPSHPQGPKTALLLSGHTQPGAGPVVIMAPTSADPDDGHITARAAQ